ncbi:MAG TPA: Nramp family divalent metal transporter [Solirubrobacterales bacterium]|jgi:NRAMP (natural resistance-associated macrophage protein) metal ion transporters|nr:Nramp family divalent metal transporter [Solirubrobacterales bacterium]
MQPPSPPPARPTEATVEDVLPGEAAVAVAARRSLEGHTRGIGRVWPFLGPAFVAAVAYIDPGNFATNVAGGAKFGYLLLWVVLAANLIAMLVQTQSAKLGIATGKNLAELCRETFSRRTSIGLWAQAELVAMATDIAEVVGAALGLNLLFGIPLFPAGVLAGAGAFAILALQQMGFRRLEAGITALVGVVVLSFVFELFDSSPDGGEIARHLFVPGFAGTESILLATGIIGATVMPHVVYLHSALTQKRIVGRNEDEKRRILGFEKVDVVIALSLAGLVNLSMMIVAAALFHTSGLTGVDSIDGAYDALRSLVSVNAATIFGIALVASGFASSSVGTMAGQVVMQGFIQRRIPIFVRRAVTLAPALLVLGIGLDPTEALVGSQVVLSFGIPFALVPLLMVARRVDIMGSLVNPRWLTGLAGAIAALIIALNVFLLQQVFFG